MLKNNYFSVLVGFVFALTLTSSAKKNVSYFDKYRELANGLSAQYDIPACVMLSVGYLESGAGTSVVAKKLNNHFGIVGDCKPAISKHKSKYKYYASVSDSYVGFCKLVSSKKFYSSMKGSKDEKLWFKKIAATGYAADATKWANANIRICQNYCH